eukprot:CAMPEP_0205812692 /NCGR_PEP_ID=MMETSP0205-20121125/17219_1 /ASSEMBLY_ACC=CAM_ASM_000278 /TAXON_ID=36767 /ORGANISM="Euplotes focardii, Strain TN1" /LENGTH=137 /DNA_ID=CAMNT_0053093771 /DNA_START=83 /DNA_END=493 /DNA_ORIENTATION=+
MNDTFSLTFSDIIFSDADGDPIEISFERNSGGAMPDWWVYNPITRVISGFANTTESSIVVKVWGGTSVSTTFTLVIDSNTDPVVGVTIGFRESFNGIVYQDIDFNEGFDTTSFVDGDGDILSYYLEAVDSDSDLPLW